MPRVRKTSDWSHLKPSYFKEFKSNHQHDLQDHILKLSPHHLALIDQVVTSANQGKKILDSKFYPQIGIAHFAPLAKQLHGHTGTVVALAKKHREIPGGGGWTNLINMGKTAGKAGLKGLQKGAKLAYAGMKVAGKYGAKAAKATGDFMIKNPQAVMAVGSTVANLMQDDTPQREYEEAPKRRKPRESRTAALDELLVSSDDDEKLQVQAKPKPSKRTSKARSPPDSPMYKTGRGLARSRWII